MCLTNVSNNSNQNIIFFKKLLRKKKKKELFIELKTLSNIPPNLILICLPGAKSLWLLLTSKHEKTTTNNKKTTKHTKNGNLTQLWLDTAMSGTYERKGKTITKGFQVSWFN